MTDASARAGETLSSLERQPRGDLAGQSHGAVAAPARRTFLYAGEWQNGSFDGQRMFLIDTDRVTWSYEMPWSGEYGQVTMLPGGNVLFARYRGATEITQQGETVWNFDAPEGTEVHTCRPVGEDQVFLVVNGLPARAMVLRKEDNVVVAELVLPTAGGRPHSQFRSCDYTPQGTYLIAHMDLGCVTEYSPAGDVLWQVDVVSPWGVSRLENGNTLVSGDHSGYVREYDANGRLVWEFDQSDAERHGVQLYSVQQSARLPNGNTLLANWCSVEEPANDRLRSVQLLEVNPDKEVVWTLSQWRQPNLGPASFFHLLTG